MNPIAIIEPQNITFKSSTNCFLSIIVLHFTPKTYIARSIFVLACVTYKKLVPSMSWEVIEFFELAYCHLRCH